VFYESLLIAAGAIGLGGALIAFDGSRDAFHPLVFIGPMLAFLYGWMPWKLYSADGLQQYLDKEQLLHVQTLFVGGVLAFVSCCLSADVRMGRLDPHRPRDAHSSEAMSQRLMIGAAIAGSLGFLCWAITIINVGGFVDAYSSSYSGGWDDSGYVRDGTLLLLTGILLIITAFLSGASRLWCLFFFIAFSLPWLSQSLLMARRGPTFAYIVVVLMGWYFSRGERPPLLLMIVVGASLGWLVLFLVTNRGAIYLGSDFDVTTDVGDIVEKPDTGNEYIYGAGSVLAAEHSGHYFWLRRYLAEVLVRPVPSAIWPSKYEDVGIPEVLENAGTGEGFADALGWEGAPGAAPGIIADLWLELWWFAVPAMGILGYVHGFLWRRAATRGGPWASQYIVLSALSMYLVMQTMEAVLFRVILLSVPSWLTWRWAQKAAEDRTPYFSGPIVLGLSQS
jgi:hypothetical protein